MIKVAITGGIGSGKSTLAEAFQRAGVPIYSADREAKRLMNESAEIRAKIIEAFGEQTYNNEGLCRQYLAKVAFSKEESLLRLNAIVHPAVRRDFGMWAVMHSECHPYVIIESAILFEAGFDREVDISVGVLAPQKLRIERVMMRDNATEEQVLARIAKQMSEEELAQRVDYTVVNIIEGEMDGAAQRLDQIFKSKAAARASEES